MLPATWSRYPSSAPGDLPRGDRDLNFWPEFRPPLLLLLDLLRLPDLRLLLVDLFLLLDLLLLTAGLLLDLLFDFGTDFDLDLVADLFLSADFDNRSRFTESSFCPLETLLLLEGAIITIERHLRTRHLEYVYMQLLWCGSAEQVFTVAACVILSFAPVMCCITSATCKICTITSNYPYITSKQAVARIKDSKFKAAAQVRESH